MKILIVDDDTSLRKLLRAICESAGHEVVAEFADGNGLLDAVNATRPDVVCLDYELPGENGLDLLVKMDVTANDVNVVMITGSEDPELKGHAADLGAMGFIKKPFEELRIVLELEEIAKARAIATKAAASPLGEILKTVQAPSPAAPQDTAVVPRSAVIVDDSGAIRLLLKGVLEGVGIKVLGVATNGREGAELVRRMRPAVVCLDVDMPVMSGLDALKHIRTVSPDTKAVMITGNAGREIVQAAITGGATGYMLKPVRPAKVEEFMRKLLRL